MSKGTRIAVSIAAAFAAGIVANLLLRAALGHPFPLQSPPIAYLGYLIGTLPGLMFDPIQLVIEAAVFAVVYGVLRPTVAGRRLDLG